MAPRGSNALGAITDPYRSVVHTRVPLPLGTHRVPYTSRPSTRHRPVRPPYENSPLGSMALFPSGPVGYGGAMLLLCYCIFGRSDPVARASSRQPGASVG